MSPACDICADSPGEVYTAVVGDDLRRDLRVCPDCLDAFRAAAWVDLESSDDADRPVLAVEAGDLLRVIDRLGGRGDA